MKKSITCPTLRGTVSGKSVPSIVGHSGCWHGRIPATVLLDSSLTNFAVRVFGILSLKTYQGNVATLGVRKLAELTGKGKSTVHRALAELESAGHIKPAERKRGQRGFYIFVSPVFGQKQRAGAEEVASYPRKRLVSVARTA